MSKPTVRLPHPSRHGGLKTRSFTLVELIIAMIALSVLFFAVVSVFQISIHRWDVQTSFSYSLEAIDAAEGQIGSDARNAVSFTTATSGGNTLYEFTLPDNCNTNATYCTSGTVSPSNIDQVNAGGVYAPVSVSGNLLYADGPQVAYYLSDITGAQTVTGGSVLWRATAPLGSTMFTPDKSWSLVNTSVARCSGITSFNLEDLNEDLNLPANAVEINMTVTETSNHTSNTFTVSDYEISMMNHN